MADKDLFKTVDTQEARDLRLPAIIPDVTIMMEHLLHPTAISEQAAKEAAERLDKLFKDFEIVYEEGSLSPDLAKSLTEVYERATGKNGPPETGS